jgi:endo-1,4-beta-xylanase
MSEKFDGGRDVLQRIRIRALVIPVAGLLLALAFGAAAARSQPPALAASTLRAAAEAKGIKFGTALSPSSNLSSNTAYINVAGGQFDAVTPGNEMKWGTVEPTQGQFNWTGADTIVSFAQAHNQVVRGHNLVWHSQLPSWVNSTNFPTPTSVINVMEQHITTEVTRFAGKVISWDVVNEPFNEDGTLRSDIFENATNGSGYIADALRTAHAADPNAKLYLNDFNIETVNAKSTAMLNLITSLKAQGVPIDAIGFESHFIEGQAPSAAALEQNMQRFINAGVSVWVTELDDRIQLSNGSASAAQLAQQATDYANTVTACLAERPGCVGITVWGFTDLDSWIPGAFPGQGAADIYDNNIQPKPSFNSTLNALGGAQSTPTPTMSPTITTTPTPPPTPTPTGGSLTATTSVPQNSGFFAQENLNLSNRVPLTSLTATITVQATSGTTFSSMFNTAGGQITMSHSSTSSAITYTFTLASGQTLAAGSYTLAAQMGGNGTVHPTSGDTFSITSSAGSLTGHF